jgi:hypothetical protein
MMNTDALAKLYDRLTPFERLPLIAAAAGRGDDVELDRLMRSAPRAHYRLPDYHGLGEVLTLMSLFHATQVLQLGLLKQQFLLTANDWEEFVVDEADQARAKHMYGMARVAAYRVDVQIDAWRRLCADLHFDPEIMLKDLPCYDQMRFAEEAARVAACTREEADAFFARPGREAVALTAEDLAKSMRAFIDERVASW